LLHKISYSETQQMQIRYSNTKIVLGK
jgi:hypothetical protein